jgi:hypothetical protein
MAVVKGKLLVCSEAISTLCHCERSHGRRERKDAGMQRSNLRRLLRIQEIAALDSAPIAMTGFFE